MDCREFTEKFPKLYWRYSSWFFEAFVAWRMLCSCELPLRPPHCILDGPGEQ